MEYPVRVCKKKNGVDCDLVMDGENWRNWTHDFMSLSAKKLCKVSAKDGGAGEEENLRVWSMEYGVWSVENIRVHVNIKDEALAIEAKEN